MRLSLAEDSALFSLGLERLLIDAGHEVVSRAADAQAAIRDVRQLKPDLAILDVRMPPTLTDDGARAAALLRAEFPKLGIILLSQRIETRYSLELATQGSFAYLLKDRVLDFDGFLEVMQRVAEGGTALDPEVVAGLLGAARTDAKTAALTPREVEVLGLMAEGLNNIGIARRLFLTQRTVETHVSSIMMKLELPPVGTGHRRVLAVLSYLGSR